MIGFLKRLFTQAKTKKQLQAAIQLKELGEWLEKTRAPIHAQLAGQLSASKTRVEQLCTAVREKISALQEAELMNPDIPERARSIMQGNREEYVRRTRQYLDSLTLPDNAEDLQEFLEKHDQDAKEFAQGILKPFHILQEFFAHETKETASLITEIEKEIITMRQSLKEAKIEEYNNLRNEITTLATKQKQLEQLKQEQQELELQLEKSTSTLKTLETEKSRLENDPTRQKIISQMEQARQEIRLHEQTLKEAFSKFEPALRRFHRMATRHVKLIENYITNPVTTLIEDLHLDIVEVAEDIQRLIRFDRISLGDKLGQVLEAMPKISKEWLGNWLSGYGKLARKARQAEQALSECDATKTAIRIQKLIDDTKHNTTILEQKLSKTRKDKERINLEELKKQLETKIRNTTGTQVTISL